MDLGEGRGDVHPWPDRKEAWVVGALEMGIRDYVAKCGFQKILVGLSGGVDSAGTAEGTVTPDNESTLFRGLSTAFTADASYCFLIA